MGKFISEKIVIYDWVSFTTKIHTFEEAKALIGMEDCVWQSGKGFNGYKDRLYFESISIHYNGNADMGVWVEMSGQGCRAFEDLGHGDYDYIFNLIIKYSADMNITRLDVAFDDKGEPQVLPIEKLFIDTHKENFVTKWREYEYIGGTKGNTIYHGSAKSDVRLRIYDKAKERGFFEGVHWIRAELQLRNERAMSFIELPGAIGEKYMGVMKNYIRYITPSKTDSRKYRWKMTKYWENFLGTVKAIKLYKKVGLEYNLLNMNKFVFKTCGGNIKALLRIYGVDRFIQKVNELGKITNPKHKKMLLDVDAINEVKNIRPGKWLDSSDVNVYADYMINRKFDKDELDEESEQCQEQQELFDEVDEALYLDYANKERTKRETRDKSVMYTKYEQYRIATMKSGEIPVTYIDYCMTENLGTKENNENDNS